MTKKKKNFKGFEGKFRPKQPHLLKKFDVVDGSICYKQSSTRAYTRVRTCRPCRIHPVRLTTVYNYAL